MSERVTIWSQGVRLAGALYRPAHIDGARRHPAIVCCHGWTAPLLEHMAMSGLPQALADAGFFVLTYDCRGWGASDGELRAVEPSASADVERTQRVREVRNVLDPEGWVVDAVHALDFIEGEPGVDPARLGVWGSSVGGGVALLVAVRDPRVRCLVSQLGAFDLRGEDFLGPAVLPFWQQYELRTRALAQARDGAWPPTLTLPEKITRPMQVEGPVQAAIDPTVRHYQPLALADRVTVPTLILDAEHEGLWDIRRHGAEAYARIAARGVATVDYRIAPGAGHDMSAYRLMGGDHPERQLKVWAVEWFEQHLGGV